MVICLYRQKSLYLSEDILSDVLLEKSTEFNKILIKIVNLKIIENTGKLRAEARVTIQEIRILHFKVQLLTCCIFFLGTKAHKISAFFLDRLKSFFLKQL